MEASISAGKATRWCETCPGWPPGLRRRCPGGGGGLEGLTMSEEGGLEELEESLRAAASCRCNWATVSTRASNRTCKASSWACSRWQLAHGGGVSVVMSAESILPAAGIQHCERSLFSRQADIRGGGGGAPLIVMN